MKTTRQVSSQQEKQIAKVLGARRTLNSGAGKFDKGDLHTENWLIEAKTCMETKKSFSIKKEWLIKMREEQYANNKSYSSLCFDFGDNGGRYYIIDENTFLSVIDILKE